MARKQALLRIRKLLVGRRDALLKSLNLEIDDLRDFAPGDSADAASDAIHHAVSSKLAELESRELLQIERAIAQIRRGEYGSCEICGKRILVARLNALPYTTLCMPCQRHEEQTGGRGEDFEAGGWDKVYDAERSMRDEHLRLSDIELDLSGSHR